MMTDDTSSPPPESHSVYLTYTAIIQAVLAVALVLLLWRRDWENAFLTAVVIGLTLIPALLRRRYRVHVPPEFQLTSAAFVFLSLFLGSVGDFYYRLWWWDMALHAGSGFLLGIVGFLALFLFNQAERLPQGIRPAFISFFGVTFAVFLGVLWEIFEFAVDKIAPSLDMQSTGVGSGVDDTMHDLIVCTGGAVIVALMGWAYTRSGRYSFIVDAVRRFIRTNPRLFRAKDARSNGSRR